MKVLLIGSGGREHALAWKLARSPLLEKLWCAPGNPGIAQSAECLALDVRDHDAVKLFCLDNAVSLVVIGPEAPLAAGLADDLANAGIAVFGPSAAAAQLEASKGFTKDLCGKYAIPTAAFGRFNNAPKAKAYVREQGAPIVIKADGLAAGKGVTVALTFDEALAAIDECFEGAFGAAGAEVVVEACLTGEEVSFFCLCDGQTALPFGSAQDHKRVGDGDTGPNTGGMGAYSPAPVFGADLEADVMERIINPTLAGMRAEGMPFSGVLYAGLMLTEDGPQLIEYNVRFGDPECQVLMMRLESDLLPVLMASASGSLASVAPVWRDETALTVVMAAKGYPASPLKGGAISGIERAQARGAMVFHAGTAMKGGKLVADGGRVLNVTAMGKTVSDAAKKAYQGVSALDFPDGFCRRDIGWRAMAAETP